MMSKKDEAISTERALKLALEALENSRSLEPVDVQWVKGKRHAAIAALREALASEAKEQPRGEATLAQQGITLDGMTANEFALAELYAFQEATGCDTADQLKAQPQQEPFGTVSSFNDWGGTYELVSPPKYRPPVGTVIYTSPPAQRIWVGLTDEEIEAEFGFIDELMRHCCYRIEAKLKEKNA